MYVTLNINNEGSIQARGEIKIFYVILYLETKEFAGFYSGR
jgi:hypothetical protein